MIVFSREQFYELVWSKPMTALAKEFGLSDVALHKICRKHDVPNPPPGWWAKKAAGKSVRVTPLPKLKAGISERIVITGAELRREPESLAAAREKARVLASAPMPDDVDAHPIVARTIAALHKSKPGHAGLVRSEGRKHIACEVAPACLDRLELALNRIVAAAAQQNFALDPGSKSAHFSGADETVGFSIAESFRRVKHELTAKEQEQLARWERKSERDRLAGRWDSWVSRPHFPEWDYHATGQLGLELEYFYGAGSPRRAFRDGKVQRLEEMAGDIAVGIAVFAAAKTEQRLEREAEQRRVEEQRRLREQALRTQHVEERRVAALGRIVDDIEQAEKLRRLLGKLGMSDAGDARVAEFIRWTQDRLDRNEAAIAAEALAKRFAEERLFGDDDDYAFRPPTYY